MAGIFRAYDVRGIFNKDLDVSIAASIGKSIGTFFGPGKSIVVGRDARLSGEQLSNALIEGIVSVGCNAIDVGIVPTPTLYYAAMNLKADGGVMVTASHLPPEWNGFKICDSQGIVLSEGTGLEKIRDIFESGKFTPGKVGTVRKENVLDGYCGFISSKLKTGKKLKVVLDLANSVASLVAPEISKRIGMDVVVIHEDLDGNFPNRPSEPTEESLQKLKQKVIDVGADIGIGYDGDADRMSIVDDMGRVFFSGNTLIPLFAKHYLEKSGGGKIVMDLTCSSSVEDYIRQNGGEPFVIRVGHSYCSHTTKGENALFGGQYSGHMCFPETMFTDDAIFASMKLIEIVSLSQKKISEMIDSIPTYFSTKMQEIPCPDEKKFAVVDAVKEKFKSKGYKVVDIDGAKIYGDDGWVLVRSSNTAPAIRVVAESKNRGRENFYRDIALEELSKEMGKL